jgi:hypothetical protein
MPRQNSMPLAQMSEQDVFTVESISDEDAVLLKSLRTSGIVPGVRIQVRNRKTKDGYGVTIGGSPKVLHLSHDAADAIRIHPPK